MHRSILRAAAILAACLPTVVAGAAAEDSAMADLVRQRGQIATELLQPITDCFARSDTDHVLFKGCIDWHSSAHAAWATMAYSTATGDRKPADRLNAQMTAERIAAERELLRREPRFEMPYGRAWFLRLAIEHRRLYGADTPLQGMAVEVADSLLGYLGRGTIDPYSGDYSSASWALINLIGYARAVGDRDTERRAVDLARKAFLVQGRSCDPDDERPEFMAVCTNWMWLASLIASPKEFRSWLSGFRSPLPHAVISPRTAHEYGLNFSRAWGLWNLYKATGQVAYREAYRVHFLATYSNPSHWNGDYWTVRHWVPQFGMFALQPLFDESRSPQPAESNSGGDPASLPPTSPDAR